MDNFKAYYKSPIGLIEISGNENAIISLYFIDNIDNKEICNTHHESLNNAVKQIDEYFNRKRELFEFNLELKGTEFQKKVWNKLLEIPIGKTISYLELAKSMGDEKLTRAVANANSKNPVSIIIPCHRVIGSNGKLTGYAGGLWRKKWLLDFENQSQLNLF